MDEERIRQLFPGASKAFVRANLGLLTQESKPDFGETLVSEVRGETKSNARPVVSIIMRRVRLLDKDNAYGAAKPLVDCLREIGCIPDDTEEAIDLQVTQQKVEHYNQQKTEVRIKYGQ